MRSITAVVLVLISQRVFAINSITFGVEQIEAQGWRLKGVELKLSDLTQARQQLSLTAAQLTLPKPFDTVEFVNLHCRDFSWGNDTLGCREGEAAIKTGKSSASPARFAFHIAQARSTFQLSDLKLGGGELTLKGEAHERRWQLDGRIAGLDSNMIKPYVPSDYALTQGVCAFDFDLEGIDFEATKINATISAKHLSGQRQDGQIAAENALLTTSLKAWRQHKTWQWQGRLALTGGAFYIEPLYLEMTDATVELKLSGYSDEHWQQAAIEHFSYRHSGAGEMTGQGALDLKSDRVLQQANLTLAVTDLKTFADVYIQPFLAGGSVEGLTLAGQLNAEIALRQNAVTDIALKLNQLAAHDAKGRFNITDANGSLYWNAQASLARPSMIRWQQLRVHNVPIGAATLSLMAAAQTVKLLEKVKLPTLDGYLTLEQFNWQAKAGTDPDVYFVGAVEQVSLAQLTEALNWTPLVGTISGTIPGVDYRDKKLTLKGVLAVTVFDGEIKLKKLASSGLFSDFPQIYADITLNNLDLDQLTRKFKIGGIQGRLSGFIRDLYLENWQPVSFYAWLGTPEDDDSTHRISQKAVENLASIGGGGAADVISRGFLRFFDSFGYDRLGLGCYLHQGVCQLMGVEPAQHGYYIVKGGGLPRIDVIGYNPRIDWQVLLQRLARITATDEVVIE